MPVARAPGQPREMALAVAGTDAAEPAEDLTPGELSVRAVVEVGFRIV
jgi:hypothetical protein